MNNFHARLMSTVAQRPLSVIALLGASALAACSTPEPELRAAVAKQDMCSACHGPDGNSVSVRAPVLAGQQQAYLVIQLKAFRDHSRADHDASAYMWPMAASLTDASIDSLASYFSASPPPPPGSSIPETETTAGKAIFDKGATERGIPPCSSCHGDKGQGLATFPRLSGQHADYLATQLAAFADESRANPIMGPMAKNLSVEEMRSLAAYLSTL